MDKRLPDSMTGVFRGCRLALHLLYGILLAIFYPHLNHSRQRHILKLWSRQLLNLLNIGIRTEGPRLVRGNSGCLIIANHVSWLDVFVLNAIYPSHFIAKTEVRDWPLIGWLCKRSGTIFIDRAMRRDTGSVNLKVGILLKQGISVGLFPEGTTTDGKQAGHFHSALIQPAIDTGAMLCPIALRYQDQAGGTHHAAVFTGDMTLAQSIWNILRCRQLDVLVAFTPPLTASGKNRRVLARSAQEAITQRLQSVSSWRQTTEQQAVSVIPSTPRSAHSAYPSLAMPLPGQPPGQ